ncbi:MAG: hypothetical protein K9G49_04995 [Taibaiella sp.]|nr:hypothetical protein [Taibaiella sp.]
MRKSSLYYIFGLLTLGVAGLQSCKRSNGIDNNNVVQTPFSLFFSDSSGAMYKTNDGRTYGNFIFPPDGKGCRAISVSGNNILWAKHHLYYSNNSGKNFNRTYDTLFTYPDTSCMGQLVDLNQSMLVTLPKWDNRVYTMSASPDAGKNWLGLVYSDNSGNPGSWGLDGTYDTVDVGKLPVRMKSLTMLANGTLCGLAYSGPAENDRAHHRNFVRAGRDESVYANRWREVTANPDAIPYIYGGNTSGTPLPPYGTTYTDTGYFYLGHMNNRLIAIDALCRYGAWYSDDLGKNWKQYSGLPANTSLLCIESPFEEVCLIGTAGKGLYILNVHTGTWQASNKGLGSNLTVRSIAAKKMVYKNGNVRKFIYLATNKGIYESADGGLNWTFTIPGNYVGVF